jgi:hypothetical protein
MYSRKEYVMREYHIGWKFLPHHPDKPASVETQEVSPGVDRSSRRSDQFFRRYVRESGVTESAHARVFVASAIATSDRQVSLRVLASFGGHEHINPRWLVAMSFAALHAKHRVTASGNGAGYGRRNGRPNLPGLWGTVRDEARVGIVREPDAAVVERYPCSATKSQIRAVSWRNVNADMANSPVPRQVCAGPAIDALAAAESGQRSAQRSVDAESRQRSAAGYYAGDRWLLRKGRIRRAARPRVVHQWPPQCPREKSCRARRSIGNRPRHPAPVLSTSRGANYEGHGTNTAPAYGRWWQVDRKSAACRTTSPSPTARQPARRRLCFSRVASIVYPSVENRACRASVMTPIRCVTRDWPSTD